MEPCLPLHNLPREVLDSILHKLDSPRDIARLSITSKPIANLLRISPLHLKLDSKSKTEGPSEAETAKCKQTLTSISNQFLGIESLDLSFTNLTDEDVARAVAKLPMLQTLSLSNCTKVTIAVLKRTKEGPTEIMPALKTLNLSKCYQLQDKDFLEVIATAVRRHPNLQAVSLAKLNLERLENMSPDLVLKHLDLQVQQKWCNLRSLCLNNVDGIGLRVLGLISKYCPQLYSMGLGGSVIQEASRDIPDTEFGQAFRNTMNFLDMPSDRLNPSDKFAIAALSAFASELPKLWLLELTFFPSSVIDWLDSLISQKAIALSPLQQESFQIIDFTDSLSTRSFYENILLPSRQNRCIEAKFMDMPKTFVDLLVHSASVTSRGGSMVDVRSPYSFCLTPLHCAAERGDTEQVGTLIKSGIILEIRGRGSGSPLFKACKEGHGGVALMLLENGLHPLIANRHDETPFYIAAVLGHEKIMDMLLSYCEYNSIDWRRMEFYKDGWTALMGAAVAGRLNVAKILVYAAGRDASRFICSRNRYGQTALHIATYRHVISQSVSIVSESWLSRGDFSIVELLLKYGGKELVSIADHYGRSAYAIARLIH